MLEQDDNDDPVERFIAAVSGIALGHLLQKGGLPEPPITPKTPYDEALRSQLTLRISTLVRLLPEREQLLVRLHYLQHLPFGHIAGVLGVTKGRVSQLHAQALARMRSRLTHPSHAGAYDR
jgi:RNA polymerase sigma factor for flagellar operon FliA